MRLLFTVLFQFLVVSSLLAAQPRVSFVRTVPAQFDLGQAEEVALIYAMGDTHEVAFFIEVLRDRVNDSGLLRLRDASHRTFRFTGEQPDEATMQKLRRNEPADAYLGVHAFACRSFDRSGESGTYDPDRKRVRRRDEWVESKCSARVDIIAADTFRRIASFEVKGDGTSSRVDKITEEERFAAVHQAARFAALSAAEQFTPRRSRESIVLDDTAPAFEDGLSMIHASRLDEARVIWETALRTNRNSAALVYNLAAVCEALGDVGAAERYYLEARRIHPKEPRYRDELRSFMRRHAKK